MCASTSVLSFALQDVQDRLKGFSSVMPLLNLLVWHAFCDYIKLFYTLFRNNMYVTTGQGCNDCLIMINWLSSMHRKAMPRAKENAHTATFSKVTTLVVFPIGHRLFVTRKELKLLTPVISIHEPFLEELLLSIPPPSDLNIRRYNFYCFIKWYKVYFSSAFLRDVIGD